MRILKFICCFLFFLASASRAEMLRSETIGNDPVKEKLCISRIKGMPGKSVPFEIDSRYLAAARSAHSDATFVAIDGMSPQLVECYLRGGTGRYEPASYSPEQDSWRLIKPEQFRPGVNSPDGMKMAANVCLQAAPKRINRPNFDHSVYSAVVEISLGGPRYHPGISVGGKRAERYDIAVEGEAFYKSSGIDLNAVKFSCLLSPMLDVKAIAVHEQ